MDHSETTLSIAADKTINKALLQDDLRLGSLLVKDGIINQSQVGSILARARKERVPFGQAAVSSGIVSSAELNRVIGIQFRHQLAQRGQSRISGEVITAFRNDHRVVEEMRALRSQLMLQWLTTDSKHNRTLAVVSPHKGDGRSFLSANLATAFAQAGHHTLLIDGDLRRPRLHRLFGLNNRAGFSTVLAGREKDSFVYRLHDVPGLSIMAAGGIPPNPTELLSPSGLADLFALCARKYQIVIVDTPAASSGSDAALIASQASGYIALTRSGKTAYTALQQMTREYAAMGANLVGSIMADR